MTQYFAGFVTAFLIFVVAIVAYFVKTKPLREQVSKLESDKKIKGILHEKFKKDILENKLPTTDAGILDRFNELEGRRD